MYTKVEMKELCVVLHGKYMQVLKIPAGVFCVVRMCIYSVLSKLISFLALDF